MSAGRVRDFIDVELNAAHEHALGPCGRLHEHRPLLRADRTPAQLVDDPPWRDGARNQDLGVLRQRIGQDWKLWVTEWLTWRIDRAGSASSPACTRSARRPSVPGTPTEPLVPLEGKNAKRFVKALKSPVMARTDPGQRGHALAAGASGRPSRGSRENAFTLGQLKSTIEAASQRTTVPIPRVLAPRFPYEAPPPDRDPAFEVRRAALRTGPRQRR